MRDKSCINFIDKLLTGNIVNNLEMASIIGCLPTIFDHPVRLEPKYQEFKAMQTYRSSRGMRFALKSRKRTEWHTSQIVFPLRDEIPWIQVDHAIASFSGFTEPFSFEIVGNKKGISYYLAFPKANLLFPAKAILQKAEPDIELIKTKDNPLECLAKGPYKDLIIHELYVTPPYYQQLFDYKSNSSSSLNSLLKIFSIIPEDQIGVYQVLFHPVKKSWDKHIKSALEAESVIKSKNNSYKTTSKELKDFLRKPLFAVRPRFACITDSKMITDSLNAIIGELQADGKKVLYHLKKDFEKVISKQEIVEMFSKRTSYMTGMILNSTELAGLVHFPDSSITQFSIPVRCFDGFRVPSRLINSGTPIGTDTLESFNICIPQSSKNFNAYRLGKSTTGKTTSMVHQIIYHIENGHGVAVFDPHDNLIPQIMTSERLKPSYEKICYFNPCDKDYVLDYNPFHIDDMEDIGRLTADYVDSSKSLFSSAWGYRMAQIMTMGYYALFILNENLSSLPVLFSRSRRGNELRKRVIHKVTNPEVKRFFESDVLNYPQEAFLPVINKITTLLMDNRINRILSRKKNKIHLNEFINEGKALLVSLPIGLLGAEISSQLGAMLLAQLQKAAFHRTSIPEKDRKPFYIFVDECYRFSAFGIYEGIINECRKFGMFINLAHQDTGQISEDTLKTFLSINNILAFGINIEDAKRLVKAFDNKIKPEQFTNLEVGQVIARIGNDIVKIRSYPPDSLNAHEDVGESIIENSRKQYYTKIGEIKDRDEVKTKRIYDSF
jgi:hypothetical protein